MGQLGTSAGRTVKPGIVSVMFECATDGAGLVTLDSVRGDNDYIYSIENESGGNLPAGVFAVSLPNQVARFAFVDITTHWPDPYIPSGKFLVGAQFPLGPDPSAARAFSSFGFVNLAGNIVTAPPNLQLHVRIDIQTYNAGGR